MVDRRIDSHHFYTAELQAWDAPPSILERVHPGFAETPILLFEFAPGVRREQGVTVTINSLGMRGVEPAIPKPNGVMRFITTGDSSVFGFGVEDNEVFSSVAAVNLNKESTVANVEDINGGQPYYSSYQSINFLHLHS